MARNTSRTDGRVFPRTGPRPISNETLQCLKCGHRVSTKDLEDSIAYYESKPWPGEKLSAEFWVYYRSRTDATRRVMDHQERFWELRNSIGPVLQKEYIRPLTIDELNRVKKAFNAMRRFIDAANCFEGDIK